MTIRIVVLLVCLGVVATSASARATKEFRPGDVRVCGLSRCIPIDAQRVLDSLGNFYYGPHSPSSAPAPRARAPFLKLVFRNGYVTGVAAGTRFDRFLSFGVNLQQFTARIWYAVPLAVAAELRLLAARLSPQPLPANILTRSH